MRARPRLRDRRGAVATARGFTLLELVIVLAVMGLLLALVPMALDKYKATVDYRDTVRRFAASLSEARQSAVGSGRATAFSVDLAAGQYGIEGRSKRQLPEGVTVRAVVAETELNGAVASVRFFPGGNASGGTFEVVRPGGDGTRLRTDWLDGRVSIERLRQ